jgi:hypothetical protein
MSIGQRSLARTSMKKQEIKLDNNVPLIKVPTCVRRPEMTRVIMILFFLQIATLNTSHKQKNIESKSNRLHPYRNKR